MQVTSPTLGAAHPWSPGSWRTEEVGANRTSFPGLGSQRDLPWLASQLGTSWLYVLGKMPTFSEP